MNTVAGILASGATLISAYYLAGMVDYFSGLPGAFVMLGLVGILIANGIVWFGSFYLFCWLLDGR